MPLIKASVQPNHVCAIEAVIAILIKRFRQEIAKIKSFFNYGCSCASIVVIASYLPLGFSSAENALCLTLAT